MTNRFRYSLVIPGICAAIAGSAAEAQTVPAGPATSAAADAPSAPDQSAGVGEIVVTAQKRSERLVNVPISITAVTGASLAQNSINVTQQLGQIVPGLRLDASGAFSQPTLRGIGSSVAGPGLSASVATYIDGIYHPSQLSNNFELADIESVQVLKGPQGTLFGRNATGGAILITTADPSFTPTVSAKVSYGRFRELRDQFTASTGLTDTLAVSVSGFYHRSDGFTKNLYDGSDAGAFKNWGLRGKLLYKPTDTLSFLFAYDHIHVNDNSVNAYSSYQGRNFANDPDTVAAYAPGTTSVAIPSERGVVSLDAPTAYRVTNNNYSLRSRLSLDAVTITSYTAYLRERNFLAQDYDATTLSGFSSNFAPLENTFSQEINVASTPGHRLNWVFGLYYFHDFSQYGYYNATFGTTTVDVFNIGVKTDSYAAFADATYDITDKIHLTLGGRYSVDRLHEFFNEAPQTPGSPTTRASTTFHSFTPRVVGRYSLTDSSNVYASWSRGYKSGAFNAAGYSTDPVKPEKIDAFEIGYKTSQRRFSVEAAAFYYDFSNLQVNQYRGSNSILVNAARAHIYGGDIQIAARVTSHLTLDLGGAYTHAQYTDFINAPGWSGTGFKDDPIGYGPSDATGNTLLRAPKLTGTAAATYTTPLADGELRLYASYYRTSKFYFDAVHDAEQKAYGLLNGRIGWTAPGGAFTVSVYGNNLTDTKYINQVLPEAPYAILQTYGAPRTYGLEFGFKY